MVTAVRDPYVGRLVGSRYEVRARIASGGMGTVYRAFDVRLEREVALKVMHAHLAADATFVERFTREARSAARLAHPGIVPVFDQGADEGAVFLAMEHVPGATLRDVLSARGALRLREALDVVEEVLAALAAAHAIGLVHRDVKPENILIGADGRLRLVDFGLARAASASAGRSSTLIGTVGYLAPELVSTGTSDERADVYAVGVVLAELLTGSQPFTGSPAQVAFRQVHEDVPLPSVQRPDLPPAVDDLVRWATARDPQARPLDAGELLAAVDRVRAALDDGALEREPRLVGAPAGARGTDGPAEREVAAPVPGTVATVAATRAMAPPAGPVGTSARTAAPGRPRAHSRRGGGGPGGPASPTATPAAGGTTGGEGVGRWSHRRVALLASGAVVVVLALLTVWLLTLGPLGRVAVPRVTPEPVADATSALRAHDLRAGDRRLVYSASVAAGDVVRTSPAAGTSARRGSAVDLVVSRGPHRYAVPAVAGRTRKVAERELRAKGLVLGTVVEAYDDTVPAGTLISQQTPQGELLTAGGHVDVTVSKGRQPIDVPNVVGQTQAAATAAITGAHLTVGTVTKDASTTVAAGSVISQTPADGTLFGDQQVSLVVSTGPAQVAVPSVVGQGVDAATATLKAAGFAVQEDKQFGGFLGLVQAQSPAGGGQAAQGSTVTLQVF